MARETVKIIVFKHGKESFLSMLDERGIKYSPFFPFAPGTIVNTGEYYEVAGLYALAGVLIAWIKARATRRIILQTLDKKTVHIEAQGYSVEEVEKLLRQADNLAIVDLKPDDAKQRQIEIENR